jgi:hypothetical protein
MRACARQRPGPGCPPDARPLVAAPRAIASLVGIASGATIAAAGVVLIAYAASLVRSARQERMKRTDAWTPIVLNLAWVTGTAVVVAAAGLSRQVNWMLLLVADVVIVFAVLEGIGLRRMGPPGADAGTTRQLA